MESRVVANLRAQVEELKERKAQLLKSQGSTLGLTDAQIKSLEGVRERALRVLDRLKVK
jgi:hypothetical protein